jgi:hypothetical protein
MSFLTPLYLFGAALVTLPILLHLLRRDVAPPVPFTAVRLLRASPVDRSRSHRLRDLLLLAARVLAVLLLAASFARPYRAAAVGTMRTTVVAVDRSFSMAAPARMTRAGELARAAIDEARGDRVMVVAFDDRADVVSASGAADDARAAVAGIEAGAGATRYAAALDRAAALLADADLGRVVIVSDLQRSGFDQDGASLPEGIDLVVRDAGGAAANLSVSNVTIDRRQVVVTVRNDGAVPRAADVSIAADRRVLPSRRITIPAEDAIEVPFDVAADVHGVRAVLSGDAADGFGADNERFAVREARTLPRILIVNGAAGSRSGFYLTRALLAAGEDGPDYEVHSLSGQAFSALTGDALRDEAAIAVLSTHGLDRRAGATLRRYLQTGGGVFIAAASDVDPAVLSVLFDWTPALVPKEIEHAGVLAATDLRHPVLRPFDAVAANFGQIAFDRAWQADLSSGWRVVARYTTGDAALAERIGGPGRVLLLTSDVDRRWNEFPLHASFVPFAQETARYLSARPLVTSSYLVADVPAGVAPVPGLVERGGRTIAVNVDPRESRVERVTPAEFGALVTRTASLARPRAERLAAETERSQNYWRYGLMLLLVTLVIESALGARS